MHDTIASGFGVSFNWDPDEYWKEYYAAWARTYRYRESVREKARQAPERSGESAGPAHRAPSADLVTAGFDDGERHPEQLESSPESVDSLGSGVADASQADVNSLVQSILQESNQGARYRLESHAEKVRLIIDQKAAIRDALDETRDLQRAAEATFVGMDEPQTRHVSPDEELRATLHPQSVGIAFAEPDDPSRAATIGGGTDEPQSEQVRFDEKLATSPEMQSTVEGMDPGELVGAIPIHLPDPPAPDLTPDPLPTPDPSMDLRSGELVENELVEAIPIHLPDPPAPDVAAPGDEGRALEKPDVLPEGADSRGGGVETTPDLGGVDIPGDVLKESGGMPEDDLGLGGRSIPGVESGMATPFGMDPGGRGTPDVAGLKPSVPEIDESALGGGVMDPGENRGVAGAPILDPNAPVGGQQAMDPAQSTADFTEHSGFTYAPRDVGGSSGAAPTDSESESREILETGDPFAVPEGEVNPLDILDSDGSQSLRAMPRPDGEEDSRPVAADVDDVDVTKTPVGVTDPGVDAQGSGGGTSVDHTKHPGMVTDPAEPQGAPGDLSAMRPLGELVTDPPEPGAVGAVAAAVDSSGAEEIPGGLLDVDSGSSAEVVLGGGADPGLEPIMPEGLDDVPVPGGEAEAIPIHLPDPPAPDLTPDPLPTPDPSMDLRSGELVENELVEAIPIHLPDPPEPVQGMDPGELVESMPIPIPDPAQEATDDAAVFDETLSFQVHDVDDDGELAFGAVQIGELDDLGIDLDDG